MSSVECVSVRCFLPQLGMDLLLAGNLLDGTSGMQPGFRAQKGDQSETLIPQREKEEEPAVYQGNHQF